MRKREKKCEGKEKMEDRGRRKEEVGEEMDKEKNENTKEE